MYNQNNPSDHASLIRFFSALYASRSKLPSDLTSDNLAEIADSLTNEEPLSEAELTALEQISLVYADKPDLLAWRLRQFIVHHRLPHYHRDIFSTGVHEHEMPDKSKWLALTFCGSSFAYHQIRKMVGAVGAVVSGRLPTDSNIIRLATNPNLPFWLDLPLAPSCKCFDD